MELQGKKILFLGDSITEGVGASSPETCFVAQVARLSGAVCLNYGIGGTRIARQQTPSLDPSTDRDFCGRVGQMAPDGDAVVVLGGTNDFGHGDAPLGSFDSRGPDTFYGALHTLYAALLEAYPSRPIAILTPIRRSQETRPQRPELSAFVAAIRQVAAAYQLPLLDLYPQEVFLHHLPDGLHPDDAGHRLLAEKIVDFLKTL